MEIPNNSHSSQCVQHYWSHHAWDGSIMVVSATYQLIYQQYNSGITAVRVPFQTTMQEEKLVMVGLKK